MGKYPSTSYKITKKLKGICTDCKEPARVGIRCSKHAKILAMQQREVRKNRKLKGQCFKCGVTLHPAFDDGLVTCITCREKKQN